MVNIIAIAAVFGALLVVGAVMSICCVMVRMSYLFYNRYQSFGPEGEVKGRGRGLSLTNLNRYDSVGRQTGSTTGAGRMGGISKLHQSGKGGLPMASCCEENKANSQVTTGTEVATLSSITNATTSGPRRPPPPRGEEEEEIAVDIESHACQ